MLEYDTINRIRSFDSGGLPVVSLYLGLDPDPAERRSVPARLKDLLRPAKELAESGELERDATLSLRQDIENILQLDDRITQDLGKGLAIFSSSANDFLEYVSLPRRIKNRAVVDTTPYIRPMMAILDEHHRYCAVVVERRRSLVYEFYMGELQQFDSTDIEGVRKRNFGGWYGLEEHRVRNHAEEEAHRHYRETAGVIFDLFQTRGFDLLLVGGHEDTVAEFIPFLHSYVRDKVAGTFTVDPHTVTPAIVRDACAELEEEYERSQERELVRTLMDTVGAGGRAVLGLERTVDAANVAAIDLLLINDDAAAAGFVCDKCGMLSLADGACAICGSPMRETPELIDELVEDVIDEGGQVEHVYAATPLAQHQLGAMTRFVVPEL